MDRYAREADGVILCNRIKAHTLFRGKYESGLVKMAVIGLGKQKGAESVHRSGVAFMGETIPQFGRVIFDHLPILAGVGILENAYEETYKICCLTAEEIWEKEPELLEEAKEKMGRIWIPEADVLVVDEIGKNISGDGMDPNVTGTYMVPGLDWERRSIRAARTVVLDLSEETKGNANGIGMADVTTRRVLNKMDLDRTYPNSVTSTMVEGSKIPLCMHSDETAVRLAVRISCPDEGRARIVRIRNSMEVDVIQVSEPLIPEVMRSGQMELAGELQDWQFDENGNLPELG